MIEVVEHPTFADSLCVKITPPHEKVKEILNSLLLTKSSKNGDYWIIPVVEFPFFKQKLEEANILDGREISDEAWRRVDSRLRELDYADRLKSGQYNKEVEHSIDNTLRTKPYPDQITGISYLLSGDRKALLDEMGCGKSFQSLATFAVRHHFGLADRCLIVCPNNVKSTWLNEIETHSSFKALDSGNGTKTILNNIKKFKSEHRYSIFIVHYEAIRIPASPLGKVAQLSTLPVLELSRINFDQIIVDECHMVKHVSAQRSSGLLYLVEHIKPTDKKLSWVLIESETGEFRWVKLNGDIKRLSIGEEIEVPF